MRVAVHHTRAVEKIIFERASPLRQNLKILKLVKSLPLAVDSTMTEGEIARLLIHTVDYDFCTIFDVTANVAMTKAVLLIALKDIHAEKIVSVNT